MKTIKRLLVIALIALYQTLTYGQTPEPEFIGEAYWEKADGSYVQLGKELGAYTSGMSWKSNSWNAFSLELTGKNAKVRIPSGESVKFIIRAVDNNSDPISMIRIYRFNTSRKKRKTVLSEDNSGTLMKSRTHTKNQLVFSGKKYGSSSYLITLDDLTPGEYGIVITNPNNVDEKRTVVACFGVDK